MLYSLPAFSVHSLSVTPILPPKVSGSLDGTLHFFGLQHMFISSCMAVKIFELDEILHSFYILLSFPSIALPHIKNDSQLNFGYRLWICHSFYGGKADIRMH